MRILPVLLLLPACFSERDDPNRYVHTAMLAEAIERVAVTVDDAAGLVAILEAESAGCWSVATGEKRGGLGEGPSQIEPGSRRVGPFSGDNVESLTHAAGEALWLWRHSYGCGRELTSRFEAYAGLGCVAWLGAGRRARMYRWATWRLTNFSKRDDYACRYCVDKVSYRSMVGTKEALAALDKAGSSGAGISSGRGATADG